MELKVYFKPVLKWWWLMLIAALVAAVSSYLVVRQQPPIYRSRTTLVIGRAVYASNPTGNEFNLNQQLANFYADIAQRDPVRNGVREALGLNSLPEFTVRVPPNTQLIEISVTDSDPVRTQLVANELANQLIKQSPTNDQAEQERQAFIDGQLNQIEGRIEETENEINLKRTELASVTSAREIEAIETEIRALEDKLSSLRTNYANLLANTNRGASNTITVVEKAGLPSNPIGPNRMIVVLLSSVIAFAIAAAGAYVLEYLDDTLKTPDEITQLLDLPVVGYITEIEKGRDVGSYVSKQPRSAIAEAFRALRTDLEFAGVDRPLKTILISSAGVSAGKTSVAINLALVMAQGGKKVILLDCDLRKPSVHKYTNISNQRGLSDVFRGNLDIYNAATNWKEGNIFIIPSGGIPPNPAELLGSKKMDQILDSLERTADIIIIDGPPFLVSDATILSSKVDGVLMVVRHGYTRRGEAVTAVRQLHRTEARILGIVLNRIPRAAEGFGGLYRYYHAYYEEEEPAQAKNGQGSLRGILGRFTKKSGPEQRVP